MTFKALLKKILRRLYKRKGTPHQRERARTRLLEMMPKNSVCAEIGVWKGNYSQRILEIVKPMKLHLIDPYIYQTGFGERLYGGGEAKSQHDMDELYQQVVGRFETRSNVIFHRNFSDNAVDDFRDAYFDWIYIDGNHYYEYVLNDLEKYFPKIKPGGYLTGDDYYWTSQELHGDRPVKRAFEEFTARKKAAIEFARILGGQFVIRRCSTDQG